jgi:hypothetical protein
MMTDVTVEVTEIEVVEVTDSDGITVVEVTIPGAQGPTGGAGTGGAGLTDGDYGDIVVSGVGTVVTIDTDVVDNTKLANMAAASVKGRAVGAGSGDPTDLTGAQVLAIIEATTPLVSQTEGDAAYQPLDADLTSWAGVTRASGFDTFAATPSSANLKTLVTDETGSAGSLVFATGPTLSSPVIATIASNAITLGTGTFTTLTFDAGASDPVLTAASGTLTMSTGDLRATTAGTNAASVVTVGGTQTLTAKTLTSPTIDTSPTAAGATWTDLGTVTTADINGGTVDGTVIGGSSAAAGTFTTVSVNDDAYAAGWNGSLNVPTKNAVYDKIETMLASGVTWPQAVADGVLFTGNTTDSPSDNDPILGVQSTGDAANWLEISNADTGNNPSIYPVGNDHNIGLTFAPKGTGAGSFDSFFPTPYVMGMGSGSFPVVKLESSSAGVGGPFVLHYHNSASPALSDEIGGTTFYGKDSAGNLTQYGTLSVVIDPTSGSERSNYQFKTTLNGSENTSAKLGLGLVVGNSGSAFPGDGNVRLTGIELGHDTDTTLTRASSGVLAVEGVNVETVATTANARIASVGITIDGGGSAITTGIKGYVEVPYACTITAWTLLADTSGAIVIDVWKDTYANFPPDNGDSITNGDEPEITASGVKAQDTSLGNWTTVAVAAGDVLAFNVDSVTSITRAHLILKVVKT